MTLDRDPLFVNCTEPNKNIPHYYIDYYKTSYLKEDFWGIQNTVMDLTS